MNLTEVIRNEDFGIKKSNCIKQSSASNPSAILTSPDEIFGDPIHSPRLGDDYQAEISSMTESLHLHGNEVPSKTGLTIPITWVHFKDNRSEELKDFCRHTDCSSNVVNRNHLPLSTSALKADIIGSTVDIREGFLRPSYQMNACEGCIPLPESRVSLWSNEEFQSFLLGLYIFGKNLVQVKKFIDCKDMNEVLSFYYGKFYRSEAYQRWADCRKTRSRKCIQGQRMFTGWRQQELLTRVLMGSPKEVHDSLLEAIKDFNEGRSSLEQLVFTLKSSVGLSALIEAVGIGKGKQDLTGFVPDPSRTNQTIHSRIKIPAGKACSALTSNDIIKFLTGDFRLNKTRSNDLFWEAVWPRLLAGGWHSERPKNICSKNTLVFLVPGVRKFSKKLVKGDKYFDSVTDVLNRVASDPRLLELQTVGVNGNGIPKNDDRTETLNCKHPSYPLPKLAGCNAEFMKFTVVDTSLVDDEGGSLKMRELRCLPFEDAVHNGMKDTFSNGSVEHSTYTSLNDKPSSEEACFPTTKNADRPKRFPNDSNLERVNAPQDQSAFFTPLLKRRRLSACKQAMRNGYHKLLFSNEIDSDMKAMEASEKASSTTSLGSVINDDSFHQEKPRRAFFDLNLPQLPPDVCLETAKQPNSDSFQVTGNENSSADEKPSSNGHRHGTRNRPPTAKALEALAGGFLNMGRVGKDAKSTRRLRNIRSRSCLSRRQAKSPPPATSFLSATDPNLSFINSNLVIPKALYHASLFAEP